MTDRASVDWLEAMTHYVARALSSAKSEADVARLVSDLSRRSDTQIEAILARAQGLPLPVCTKGCAYCCHQSVEVLPTEAINIAHNIRTKLAADALAHTREKLAKLDERTRNMGTRARAAARLPCALLVGNLCSIYEARPLSCRSVYSFDADKCRKSFTARRPESVIVDYFGPAKEITRAYASLLKFGAQEAGLSAHGLRLAAALRVALGSPEAAERWLVGADPFKATRFRM